MSEPTSSTAAIITVSDRCSRGEESDTTGPAVVACCVTEIGLRARLVGCVPDEPAAIERAIRDAVASDAAIVLTTGGTGLGPRDNTPEAAMRVIDRPHPQLLELARARCLPTTPNAYLSRGVAGLAGRALIVTLPGSRRGALETLRAVADVLPHALLMMRGSDHAR